jgi:hypothetical protein
MNRFESRRLTQLVVQVDSASSRPGSTADAQNQVSRVEDDPLSSICDYTVQNDLPVETETWATLEDQKTFATSSSMTL